MSKRRHRSRPQAESENSQGNINQNNNPFGINPAQLMNMLGGNLDMSGLNNMISSMNMDGFDLSNLNLGSLQGMFPGMGGSPQGGNSTSATMGDLSNFNFGGLGGASGGANESYYDDDNIQMLMAIRSIVDTKRGRFIDKIIQMYNQGAFKD